MCTGVRKYLPSAKKVTGYCPGPSRKRASLGIELELAVLIVADSVEYPLWHRFVAHVGSRGPLLHLFDEPVE